MGLLARIIFLVIPLVAFTLFSFYYFGGEGVFEKTFEVAKGAEEYLPDAGIKEVKGEKPTIKQEHTDVIMKLKSTIDSMMASDKKNCFANYGGFSELGEKGASIILSYDPSADETRFSIYGGAGGQQLLTDLLINIKGMKPCVIAGSEQLVDNFDASFLNTNSWSEKSIKPDHFNSVSSVRIAFNLDGFNENRIDYGFGFKDFEDGGYIYTPDNTHICFFPTVDGNNVCDGSGSDGLDDDCLGADPNEDISIPRQVAENKLLSC